MYPDVRIKGGVTEQPGLKDLVDEGEEEEEGRGQRSRQQRLRRAEER